MNRIEAINAMLEGKKVTNPSYLPTCGNYMFYCDRRFWITGEVTQEVVSSLNRADGYEIYEEPADNYAMIDGKKYKLVEE